jgi:predicted O-methyltransferase YrrM
MKMDKIETREEFHKVINELGLETGVEIGLGFGLNSEYLLDNSNIKKLYGVDNWDWKTYNKSKEDTINKMSAYGKRFQLVQKDSVEAAKDFEDGSLDFVYIDGDHMFDSVIADLVAWYPKVREGGFFGGHDYVKKRRKCEVYAAVNTFFDEIERDFNKTEEHLCSFWMIK